MTLLFLADYNNRGAWLRFYVITLILTVGFYEEVVDGEGGGRAVAGRWQRGGRAVAGASAVVAVPGGAPVRGLACLGIARKLVLKSKKKIGLGL